jgi:hypothetical protein
MQRQRAARIADVDTRGLLIWDDQREETLLAQATDGSAPVPAHPEEDNHLDGHPIEVIARIGSASR